GAGPPGARTARYPPLTSGPGGVRRTPAPADAPRALRRGAVSFAPRGPRAFRRTGDTAVRRAPTLRPRAVRDAPDGGRAGGQAVSRFFPPPKRLFIFCWVRPGVYP